MNLCACEPGYPYNGQKDGVIGCYSTNSSAPPAETPLILPSMSVSKQGKRSPYSITEHRVQELIPVLCSQPAGDVSHKPGGRLPLLSARPAVTPATRKRAATNFAA